MCAIKGLNTFNSNWPCDPAIVIPLWFPITLTQTIVTASDWVGLTFPGIIDEPGSFTGRINSLYPALGPEPKYLMSFAIFIRHTAAVFNVPEKFTIASWAANAANLFFAGLKFIFVILLISLQIFLSKFFLVFIPVPTAVPPCAKKFISFNACLILIIVSSNCDWYPENSCPSVKGVASWRCVLPTFIIFLNFETFFFNSLFNKSNDGNNLFFDSNTIAMCIALGNTSLVDWDLFTWSFGCTGFFDPSLPFKIWIALFAITSLTFILVWVPDPVCQTFKGKCWFNLPFITSFEALIIAFEILGSICFSFLWTMAADFFIIAIDLINIGLTLISPISKNFFDLCVDAPQYLSTGTFIPPMLSYSFLVFII